MIGVYRGNVTFKLKALDTPISENNQKSFEKGFFQWIKYFPGEYSLGKEYF